MGNFFTSTQIYNEGMVKSEKFIDMFCKAMKKEGYVTCEGDESEKSYILRFADNCRWVTIASEEYDEGNAAADAGKIAKMLGTTCVNTNVIDSDCAVMEMYVKSGQKANTIVVGRADDYFGKKPKISEQVWKPFLAEGMTWEKLCNILNDSEEYTFVEDCLSELAPIIGMNEDNIIFSAEDAEEDKQTVFLGFKKAAAKEKKLTFVSAFKLVFGEMLEPMGYKYFKKGKYPYFVKVINNEILHIISYSHISSSIVGHKAMEIHGGAISLYRRKIDLTGEPTCWLSTIHSYYNGEYNKLADDLLGYECNMSDNESLTKDMKRAAELVKEFILSNIENVVDLESYIKYAKQFKRIDYELCDIDEYENNPSKDYNESYLLVITHDNDDGIKRMEESITRQLTGMSSKRREESEERIRKQASNRRLSHIALRDRLINDKESFKRIESILQKNKGNNIELLKSYGLFQEQDKIKAEDKKEKKLTLNAAFKQVYGELLEPMGFKLVKSKYPYYLRVVGEGIIQAVSVAKEKSIDDPNEEIVSIYVGVSLLSLPLINFDKNPKIVDNQKWMLSLNGLYGRFLRYLDEFEEKEYKERSLFLKKGEKEEMLNALQKSRLEFMPFVIEFLEKLKTLEDIYQAGEIVGLKHNASILLGKMDVQIAELEKRLPERIKMLELEYVNAVNTEFLEVEKEDIIKNFEKRKESWTSLKKGGEAYVDYMKTAEKTTKDNLKILKELGVISV